jgi:hypothetical protein
MVIAIQKRECEGMWLEMSRDPNHGGPGWGFAECLWSPSHKNPSGSWPFWSLLKQVRKGDIVVHLRGKTHQAAFRGYSLADADGSRRNNGHPSLENGALRRPSIGCR